MAKRQVSDRVFEFYKEILKRIEVEEEFKEILVVLNNFVEREIDIEETEILLSEIIKKEAPITGDMLICTVDKNNKVYLSDDVRKDVNYIREENVIKLTSEEFVAGKIFTPDNELNHIGRYLMSALRFIKLDSVEISNYEKATRDNLNKKKSINKWKIATIALVCVIGLCLIGALSSDTSSGEVAVATDINTTDTTAITEELATDTIDGKESDRDLLITVGEATMEFLSSTSNKFSAYSSENNMAGAIGYAIGLSSDESRSQIEDSFTGVESNLKTDEGRELFYEFKSLFDDYMIVVENISEGIFDDETSTLLQSVSSRIPLLTTKIENF